jgi:phosphatidylinositol-3-phosphatase
LKLNILISICDYMNIKTSISLSLAGAIASFLAYPTLAATTTEGVPKFDHQFVIMMENHSYDQIIGSQYTPYINQLASKDNLATNYYAVTHPSLPNYLAVVAGDTFGNGAAFNNGYPDPNGGNDNPPTWSQGTPGAPSVCTTTICDPGINSPSIADQLKAAGLTWKTYQENIPSPGSNWANSTTNGVNDKLYAVKHNPFAYFTSVQNDPNLANEMVGFNQLQADLASGNAPNFSFIAPNQCNDMHGDPAGGCPYGNTVTPDANEIANLTKGDNAVKSLVTSITGSSLWSKGNNAIYVLWDENDYGTSSNKEPVIAITNNGPLGLKDNTYATSYSFLRTLEDGAGITSYLGNAATASPMVGLFAPVPEPVNMLGVGLAGVVGLLLKRALKK